MLGEIGFEPFGQFTTGKHDPPATAFAFQPNIRAQARDRPLIGATGMLFAQAQVIVEMQFRKHSLDG
jgi:hypothetical protein